MKQKTNNLKLVTIILTVIFSLVTGLLSRRIKVLNQLIEATELKLNLHSLGISGLTKV